MKLSTLQIKRLVRTVLRELVAHNAVILKTPEAQILKRGEEVLQADADKEQELEREVHRMLDDLERQNAGEFQRHKMFLMLKKKLAQEKGFVL